jgi:hypothetical protein
MDFKHHRANAVKLLAYIESIKSNPSLIPPDGTLQGTIEIALAKELNRIYKVGFNNCRGEIDYAIAKISP